MTKRSVSKSAVAVTLSVDYGDSTKRTKSNPASAVGFGEAESQNRWSFVTLGTTRRSVLRMKPTGRAKIGAGGLESLP